MKKLIYLTVLFALISCEKEALNIEQKMNENVVNDTMSNDTISNECIVCFMINPGIVKRNIDTSLLSVNEDGNEITSFECIKDTIFNIEIKENSIYTFEVKGNENYKLQFEFNEKRYTWGIIPEKNLEIIYSDSLFRLYI